MYRWLFLIGLILLVVLAGGSAYAWDGHGRSSGHSWGGHGYQGHGYQGHGGHWGPYYRGYGWGGPRFYSPWSLLIPPLPIPVPVPAPPFGCEPY